jgi:hypothetical protein
VHAADVKAADLIRASTFRFEFQPIIDSKNTPYRFDLTSSAENEAEGVALWATRGDRYGDGAMHVNDVPRWADLAFETFAPTPSRWRMLSVLPSPRGNVAVTAFAIGWLVLGVMFRILSRFPE